MAVHSRAPEIVNHRPPPDLGVEKPATLMHPNAFDRELAKLDLVETADMAADGTDSDANQRQQRGDDCVDDAEGQPLETIWLGKSISHYHPHHRSGSIGPDGEMSTDLVVWR
jgi:hypothetical protein